MGITEWSRSGITKFHQKSINHTESKATYPDVWISFPAERYPQGVDSGDKNIFFKETKNFIHM